MGCFFVLHLLNRPAIPPFGKINFMYTNDKEIAKEQLKAQKESQMLAFKQDCRRTAMQLSERIKPFKGEKNADGVIKDAEKLYKWLIDVK